MNITSISVVIPYYRGSGTIARALQSVVSQTVQPCEIIIIDDGSPDDVVSAIAEFASATTLLRKPNGGAASARNMGIEHARGDWIAFLDADDYWEPGKLEMQLAIAAQNEGVGLIASRWFRQTPGYPRELETWCDPALLDRPMQVFGRDAFHLAMHLWTSSLLIKRDVIGSERFTPGLEPAEDRDFWVRLVCKTSVFFTSQPLATYVMEPGGISRSNVERDCGNMLRVVHRHAELLGAAGVREQEAIIFRRWAGLHLSKGNASMAIRPALERVKRQPRSPQAWWVILKSAAMSLTR